MKRKDSRITKVESFASLCSALLCSAETECVFVLDGSGFVCLYWAEKVAAVFSGKKREAVFVIQLQSQSQSIGFFFFLVLIKEAVLSKGITVI